MPLGTGTDYSRWPSTLGRGCTAGHSQIEEGWLILVPAPVTVPLVVVVPPLELRRKGKLVCPLAPLPPRKPHPLSGRFCRGPQAPTATPALLLLRWRCYKTPDSSSG
ncbi:hypothetical protein NDU88_005983 [Pleurodeles waltl]|uniref:Uncharacterized protein n=1 Tax=Pleurodeles waltl TaxID=8319 RepID=A0AAV7SN75_PLEWA|nr:hypothetical protein NDU88_005983 [Pleurodeles waltl]